MTTLLLSRSFDRARLAHLADWLAVGIAVALPWSTSAVSILAVLWVLVLIPTLSWADLRRVLQTPAGGLPVALFLLGVIGMAWADVSLLERWKGLDSFIKLLAIPLLLVQFRRSDRAVMVFAAYAVACVALLAATTIAQLVPAIHFLVDNNDHILVKNAATQSNEFVTAIFGLLFVLVDLIERRRWLWASAVIAACLGMLANMTLVTTGRTALVLIPVLILLFAVKRLRPRGMVALFAAAVVLAGVAWLSSPYLRTRTITLWTDYQSYQKTDAANSSGQRMEFWKKSLRFVEEAPVFGNGTGSIHSLFEKTIAGQTGAAASDATNPHNQTLAVAIQLGVVGALLLWAMWIAHLLLFRGNGLVAWVGLLIVVQNVLGSLVNSHLFDFVQGWVYVVGVGVAGGAVLKNRIPSTRHRIATLN